MTFNPLKLVQLKGRYQTFRTEHPEMPDFGRALKQKALRKGCSFTVRAVTPEGDVIENTITMTENDVEIIRVFVED